MFSRRPEKGFLRSRWATYLSERDAEFAKVLQEGISLDIVVGHRGLGMKEG